MYKTQLPAVTGRPLAEVAAMLRQDRQLQSFLTLAEEAPDQARANLPAYLRSALPMLVEHAMQRCAPADPVVLTEALTRTLAQGMGGPMSDSERAEWYQVLNEDMRDIPGDLALEALREARRHCTRASEVLPFVHRFVEDYPARRRARLKSLINLADVAGVEID